ncbi:MAG: transcriptional regulator [Oscillospiraceae bacterium]|nr:transcriptional regulator [Oscillospiraceae bacterium]
MDCLRFADKATREFNEIMASNQKDMLESINRANKGELFVLHFLAAHEAHVIPSALSAAMHASTGRISALLGVLEKKGQITREIDKSNRRSILVTITKSGRERAETEMKSIKESLSRVFMEMGEEETALFLRMIRRFFELSQKHMHACAHREIEKQGGGS